MSFNRLSIASARPALQPCVSVLVVWGIQEYLCFFPLLNDRYKRSTKMTLSTRFPK